MQAAGWKADACKQRYHRGLGSPSGVRGRELFCCVCPIWVLHTMVENKCKWNVLRSFRYTNWRHFISAWRSVLAIRLLTYLLTYLRTLCPRRMFLPPWCRHWRSPGSATGCMLLIRVGVSVRASELWRHWWRVRWWQVLRWCFIPRSLVIQYSRVTLYNVTFRPGPV